MTFIRTLGISVALCLIVQISLAVGADAPLSMKPGVEKETVLKLTQYLVVSLAVVGAMIVALGIAVIRVAREDALKVTLAVFQQADTLRMVTVMFIVTSISLLAMTGVVDGAAVPTIFSGIAGYVLGTGHRPRRPVESSVRAPSRPPAQGK